MPFKYLNDILEASQPCRKRVKNEGFEQFEQFQTVKLSNTVIQSFTYCKLNQAFYQSLNYCFDKKIANLE